MDNVSEKDVLDANIEVHSALANSGEYNKSPHFRKENQENVKNVLKNLVNRSPCKENSRLLDMGCGTGFIINLAKDLVAQIDGIDITKDMMNQIDLSSGNIKLHLGQVEKMPFEDEEFDIATAYSFMDHLLDYRLALREAYRVLKPGGVFYSGLNPNRSFSLMLESIEKKYGNQNLPHAISREIKGMLHNGAYYREEFGLNEDDITKAEPEKSLNKGFNEQEVTQFAKEIGFSSVESKHEWFLGQGVLMNLEPKANITQIDEYLDAMLPASESFYKYLRFVFVK